MSNRVILVDKIISLLTQKGDTVNIQTDNPEKEQKLYHKLIQRREADLRVSKDVENKKLWFTKK